ncbi:TPA: nucleotide-binding protein [Bacillus cereus]|nr:nucleotide-binding protein [Bacillus cereus]
MYYHVRIDLKDNTQEGRYNITKEELENRFLNPYDSGDPIVLNGRTLELSEISRISINVSQNENELESQKIQIEYEDQRSDILMFNLSPLEWRAAERLKDVTDAFITGAPGQKNNKSTQATTQKKTLNKQKAFIVHGHDTHMKQELEIFLHSIDIEPIVLHRQADEGLTIIEKFEKHSDVQYAFVLLTPDDIGTPIDQFDEKSPLTNYEFRARQNVIFELGYFIGKLGRGKVCTLYKEGITLPSDIQGLVYKKINERIEEVGFPIIQELKKAGLSPQI